MALNAKDSPQLPGHKAHHIPNNTTSPTADDYVGLIIGIVSGMVILILICLGVSVRN